MKNVLCLDDELLIVRVLSYLFNRRMPDLNVVYHTDSEEAIKEIKRRIVDPETRIDLLVQDSRRPKIDGFETLEILKKIDPTLRVIMHSSLTLRIKDEYLKKHNYKETLRKYKINGYIRKPADSDYIVHVIQRSTKQSTGLCILTAPPGYGKSTLIEEMQLWGVEVLKKITTRPYRTDKEKQGIETESISDEEFEYLKNTQKLVSNYRLGEFKYGMRLDDFFQAIYSKTPHIYATCNPRNAILLKKKFPFQIKIIMLTMPSGAEGLGLERRLIELPEKKVVTETRNRLYRIIAKAIRFKPYYSHADLILPGADLYNTVDKILDSFQKNQL